MKRALSLIFIFLLVSSIFAMLPVARAEDNDNSLHRVFVYDAKGRICTKLSSAIIRKYMKVYIAVNKGWWILGWTKIIDGEAPPVTIHGYTGYTADIRVMWLGKEVYHAKHIVDGDINITLNIIPAVPISVYSIEPVKVSPSLHEISTKVYSVKFGYGKNGNEIQITLAGSYTRTIPVNLHLNKGSASEDKPFKFLAQNPNSVVKETDKFLIWDTAYHYSAVKTAKVGQGMFLIVWTYGYTDVAGAWIKTVVASILAGAVLGATTGPEGALAGATIAGMASAIAWAVKPDLMDLEANTGLGVVVGLFTPRWFILQAVGGLGSNSTIGSVNMDTGKSVEHATSNGYIYDISTTANELQAVVLKDVGDIHTKYFDFEDGTSQGFEALEEDSFLVRHDGDEPNGYYSLELGDPSGTHGIFGYKFGGVKKGTEISIDVSMLATHNTASGGFYIYCGVKKYDGTWENSTNDVKVEGIGIDEWTTAYASIIFTAPADGTLYLLFRHYASGSGTTWNIDEITIKYYYGNKFRTLFRDNIMEPYIRLAFDTIPTIAPARGMGITIPNRAGIIMIDLPENTGLAVDWASPLPMVIPSRIIVHSDTWKVNGILLATDDEYGFQNTTFVAVNPRDYVYKTDWDTYTLFFPPQNWTYQVNWTPFIANHTMIYVPNFDSIPPWAPLQYNLASWWQNIGTWGHLALYGLGLLILFIILLILAPWIITALIKILSLIIRAIAKLIVAAAKGMGKMMKSFKRRRKG